MTEPFTLERKKFTPEEEDGWDRVQELKNSFSADNFNEVGVETKEQAIERALQVANQIFEKAREKGIDLVNNIEPGHGIGHIMRDQINALRLGKGLEVDPKHLFIGMLGGIFHDIGCVLIKRYEESSNPIGHAGTGALLLDILEDIDLSPAEKKLIQYSVAASTHYLGDSRVTGKTGKEYTKSPYEDLDKKGEPLMGIWLTRWTDRLDLSGPHLPARHFLTLLEDHDEFDGQEKYAVGFADHMRPLLRSDEERGGSPRTMLEHIKMYADSQTNNSPYGKHDQGEMIDIRDRQKERLYKIINAIEATNREGLSFTPEEEDEIIEVWNKFLSKNISPSPKAVQWSQRLSTKFSELPETTRFAWLAGFKEIMKQYVDWYEETSNYIEQEFTTEQRHFQPLDRDLLEIIEPIEEIKALLVT